MRVEVGQTWFVRPPQALRVVKVFISDVTPKTVEYQEIGGSDEAPVVRYKTLDVEFVEQVTTTSRQTGLEPAP